MSDAWVLYVIAALALVAVVVLVALLLNVHKMLSKVSAIRREVEGLRDGAAGSQLVEAVAQLQSVAASADRVAARCDSIEKRLEELGARAAAPATADMSGVAAAVRDSLAGLQGPVSEIRDRLAKSDLERLADEVRRCLYIRGFDNVTVLTDLSTVPESGETRVQVEVVREGVRSKGWVLVRDGSAVEAKVTPGFDMFP